MVLNPLQHVLVSLQCDILMSLTELLQNLVIVELPRHRYCQQLQKARGGIEKTFEDLPDK